MQTITLFSGVPFDRKCRQIPYFANEQTRQTFLAPFAIDTISDVKRFTMPYDSITVNGTAQTMTANYMMVVSLENMLSSYDFYFVTDIRKTGSGCYELSLEVDLVNTWLLRNTTGQIESPTINTCAKISDSYFDNPVPHYGKLEPSAWTPSNDEENVAIMTADYATFGSHERLYLFLAEVQEPDLVYYYAVGTKYDLLDFPHLLSQAQVIHADSEGHPVYLDIKPVRYYFFPVTFGLTYTQRSTPSDLHPDVNPYIDYTNDVNTTRVIAYVKDPEHRENDIPFSMGCVQTGYQFAREFSFSFIPDSSHKYYFGTRYNRQPINSDNVLHNLLIEFSIVNSELVFVGKCQHTVVDLLPDFETATYDDNYINYITHNANQLRIANLQRAMNFASSVSTTAVSMMGAANPVQLGANLASGSSGIVSSGMEYLSVESKKKDLMNAPEQITALDRCGATNCFKSEIGIFRYCPSNYSEMCDSIYEFGFRCYVMCQPDWKQSHDKDFRYLQTVGCQFVGKMPVAIADGLSNIFDNGVRVFYNPSKMIAR